MEQGTNQSELELYKTFANEILAKLRGIEYPIGSPDYTFNICNEKMTEGLDLRDIAETLGL